MHQNRRKPRRADHPSGQAGLPSENQNRPGLTRQLYQVHIQLVVRQPEASAHSIAHQRLSPSNPQAHRGHPEQKLAQSPQTRRATAAATARLIQTAPNQRPTQLGPIRRLDRRERLEPVQLHRGLVPALAVRLALRTQRSRAPRNHSHLHRQLSHTREHLGQAHELLHVARLVLDQVLLEAVSISIGAARLLIREQPAHVQAQELAQQQAQRRRGQPQAQAQHHLVQILSERARQGQLLARQSAVQPRLF